jgi:hypothetical protein
MGTKGKLKKELTRGEDDWYYYKNKYVKTMSETVRMTQMVYREPGKGGSLVAESNGTSFVSCRLKLSKP